MGTRKKKLNLTIGKKFREKADSLAEIDNRSLSNLFEVLVDEEWNRTRSAVKETHTPARLPEKAKSTKRVGRKSSRKRTRK